MSSSEFSEPLEPSAEVAALERACDSYERGFYALLGDIATRFEPMQEDVVYAKQLSTNLQWIERRHLVAPALQDVGLPITLSNDPDLADIRGDSAGFRMGYSQQEIPRVAYNAELEGRTNPYFQLLIIAFGTDAEEGVGDGKQLARLFNDIGASFDGEGEVSREVCDLLIKRARLTCTVYAATNMRATALTIPKVSPVVQHLRTGIAAKIADAKTAGLYPFGFEELHGIAHMGAQLMADRLAPHIKPTVAAPEVRADAPQRLDDAHDYDPFGEGEV